MTDPTNSALHMMEGQGGDGLLPCPFRNGGENRIDHQNMWTGMRNQLICVHIRHWCEKPSRSNLCITANTEEEAVSIWNRRAAPKTALSHFADEVEASGEAEKHAVQAGAVTVHNRLSFLESLDTLAGPHFAIPPSTDVATLQRELSIAYDQIVCERAITKEMAKTLKEMAKALRDCLAYLENDVPEPNYADAEKRSARAALAKVQS